MRGITIGRAGYDVPIPNVASVSHDGEQLRVRGRLLSRTLHSAQAVADAKVLRQQLLGYADNFDEETIPVTYDKDSTVDGFYRVTRVNVDVESGSLSKIGAFPYEVDLERVTGYASPLFESIMLGALRVNTPGITAAQSRPWHVIPQAAIAYTPAFDFIGATNPTQNRVSADGTLVGWFTEGNFANGTFYKAKPRWSIPPASFFIGAATLEIGSTLHPVVGQQIENLPANWRLSNGLLRVTPGPGSTVDVSVFDGTVWDTAVRFRFANVNSGTFGTGYGAPQAITVMHNSPEEVAIRLQFSSANGQWEYVDLSLRRGARMISASTSATYPTSGASGPGIRLDTNTAGTTTLVGGVVQTTAVNGNKYVLAAPRNISKDGAVGGIYQTSAVFPWPFAFGFEVNSASATANDLAQDLVYQYMAAVNERMTVVAR